MSSNSFAGKKVLITGGAGFLGCNLARELVSQNADVTVSTRSGKNTDNLHDIGSKIKIVEGDLANENFVEEQLNGIEYLFHFAWQNDLKRSMAQPKEDIKADMIGLLNILETAKNFPNLKILFASTSTIIGMPSKLPCDEMERDNPLSVYEINKLAAEHYLKVYYKSYGVKSTVIRLSNVFGEYQRIDNPGRGVLNFMIGKAFRGEKLTIYGKGDFIRDYTYMKNYMDAFMMAMLSPNTNGEMYILGSGKGLMFTEIVEKIQAAFKEMYNKNVESVFIHFPKGENEVNKRNFIADCTKLTKATGWVPKISFDEGLKRTIEFYNK